MQAIHRQHLFCSLLTLTFISLACPTLSFAATANWQGPYAGAYVGGGFGNNHLSTNTGSITDTSYFTTSADSGAVSNAGSKTNSPSTLIAGVQAGHDWVYKQMVYGVAGDYGVMPLSSSNTVNQSYADNSGNYSVYTSMSTNWLFTLRGRVGYPIQLHWPSLLYVTGGMAMTQLKVNSNFSDNSSLTGTGGSSTADNQIGWTAGAGVELASLGHATLDLEYLYVRVPSVKVTSTISNSAAGFGVPAQSLSSTFTTTGDFHANLLRLGVNYRFDE